MVTAPTGEQEVERVEESLGCERDRVRNTARVWCVDHSGHVSDLQVQEVSDGGFELLL